MARAIPSIYGVEILLFSDATPLRRMQLRNGVSKMTFAIRGKIPGFILCERLLKLFLRAKIPWDLIPTTDFGRKYEF